MNSTSETEKTPQGLTVAPEGAFQLQTGISNPRLSRLNNAKTHEDLSWVSSQRQYRLGRSGQ